MHTRVCSVVKLNGIERIDMSRSGLNLYQDELLEILAEECGEIVQEKSKIFRFGMNATSWHDTTKLHSECLAQELGDFLAMVELLVDSDMGITYNDINAAKERKLTKVVKWMKYQKPEPIVPGSTADVMHRASELAHQQLNNYKDVNK